MQGETRLGLKKNLQADFLYIRKNVSSVKLSEPKEDLPIKRTSITLEDPVYEAGQQIASKRGFGQSFSAYIAWLIQRDAEGGVTREDAVFHGAAKPAARKTAKGAKSTKPAKTAKRAKAKK